MPGRKRVRKICIKWKGVKETETVEVGNTADAMAVLPTGFLINVRQDSQPENPRRLMVVVPIGQIERMDVIEEDDPQPLVIAGE